MNEVMIEPREGAVSDTDLARFAGSLQIARELWQRYPTLVESPELPEPFLGAYRWDAQCEPGETSISGEEELIARGLLKPQPAKG